MLALLILFEATAAAPARIDFDLATLRDHPGDRARSKDEIVVLGRPIRTTAKPDDRYERTSLLPRAEIGLGGGASLDVHGQQVTLANGVVSNRIMVGLKIPIGPGKRR